MTTDMIASNSFNNATHEPLADHRLDRGGQQEVLHTEVEQTQDRRRRVVGVQRREDQVARQRRLHRDLGGFQVADLADEDDVGVGRGVSHRASRRPRRGCTENSRRRAETGSEMGFRPDVSGKPR